MIFDRRGCTCLRVPATNRAVDLSASGIMMAPIAQELALVASVPLTDEPWEPIDEGEVIALKDGLVWARLPAAVATQVVRE